jgi:hypothetical protein
LTVRQAKSEAGAGRAIPIAASLKEILGDPGTGRVSRRSVMSGKFAESARKSWEAAKLEPIGLHESRHTYASLLIASGYNLKELMTYLGHADLTTTSRYVKMLPQSDESNAGDPMREIGSMPTSRHSPVGHAVGHIGTLRWHLWTFVDVATLQHGTPESLANKRDLALSG